MKQLTIRGFDEAVAREIERVAKEQGISLNQSVQRILRRGAGPIPDRKDTGLVGSSLDHFIGTWSQEEAEELERAVADFEGIDESMWA